MSAIITHIIIPGSDPVSYIFMVTGDSDAAFSKYKLEQILFKLLLMHPLQFL